jgi:hypothetical protein
MPAALSPDLAVSYVSELSADVRAVVVLGAAGELLAGPASLAAPARAFVDAGGGVERTPDGVVVAARTPAHAVLAVAGPLVLEGPTLADVRAAAEALGGGAASPDGGASTERQRAAQTVISAT